MLQRDASFSECEGEDVAERHRACGNGDPVEGIEGAEVKKAYQPLMVAVYLAGSRHIATAVASPTNAPLLVGGPGAGSQEGHQGGTFFLLWVL